MCPEMRRFEMRRHKEIKHNILLTKTGRNCEMRLSLPPPAIRILSSSVAVNSYTLSYNSFITVLNYFDLGGEPGCVNP